MIVIKICKCCCESIKLKIIGNNKKLLYYVLIFV